VSSREPLASEVPDRPGVSVEESQLHLSAGLRGEEAELHGRRGTATGPGLPTFCPTVKKCRTARAHLDEEVSGLF
jgi:hypothetical protein